MSGKQVAENFSLEKIRREDLDVSFESWILGAVRSSCVRAKLFARLPVGLSEG